MNRKLTEQERLIELLQGFDNAMLVTCAPTGPVHARPMALAQVETDGTTWFLTAENTAKIQEIRDHSQVAVAFQSDATFASVSGIASVVRDRAKVHQLWSEAYRAWFPDGPDQADLVAVRVSPEIGEFWDSRGAHGLRYLWESAKAVASGDKVDEGALEGKEHGKVKL
jgi:general stress protein 26